MMNVLFKTSSAAILAAGLAFGGAARAHPTDASAASALSLALPVAVSVAAPVMLLSGGVVLTVVAVEASAAGTVWVLERASDGARASVTFSARAGEALLLGTGTAVAVGVLSTGWVLSAAGRAIAFVPNEIGASLLHSEQLSY